LLRYPQLKGLPVVIGGGRRKEDDLLGKLQAAYPEGDWTAESFGERLDRIPVDFFPRIEGYTGRGVITTATYAARQFGVGSAMGLMKAAKLCPQAILLPVDFEQYRHYSRTFKGIITEIAPLMEDRGVDEVYIDFTEVPGGQREGGRVLARLIQKAIHDATGLTCSIGVAPNKLLAKMASEFHKPNGPALSQDQWHWPQSRGPPERAWHSHHWRVGGPTARLVDGPFRQNLWRLAARCRPWARRAAHRHRKRAGVDEPRNHLRARPACGA